MSHYVIHNPDGRITQTGFVPDSMLKLQGDGGKNVVVGQAELHRDYVQDGKIKMRPAQATQLNGMVLSNLPSPCTIYIDGEAHACSNTTVELEFTYPANYVVHVEAFPYLDTKFNVVKT